MSPLLPVGRRLALLLLLAVAAAGRAAAQDEDAKPLKLRATIKVDLDSGFYDLAVTADGKRAIGQTSGKTRNVQIWDLEKPQLLHTFDNNSFSVLGVAILPGDQLAAYVRQQPASIVIVNLATGAEVRRLQAEKGKALSSYLRCIAVSPKGDLLVVGSGNSLVGWDPATGEHKFRHTTRREVTGISAIFDDGKAIAVGHDSGTIEVWDLTTGKVRQEVGGGKVKDVAVSPDGKTLAWLPFVDSLRIVDLTTGRDGPFVRRAVPGTWPRLRMLPDGKAVVFADVDRRLRVVDLASGATTHVSHRGTRIADVDAREMITAVAVAADGSCIVTAEKGALKVYEWQPAK